MNSGTCVNGTDYPDWMASDRDFVRLYLFKTLRGCCKAWFTDHDTDGCEDNVIQGLYAVDPCATNRPDRPECNFNLTSYINVTEQRLAMWYPDFQAFKCRKDRNMPSWMLQEDYVQSYLFNSRAQCCGAFGYC